MKIPLKLKSLKILSTLLIIGAFAFSVSQAYQAPNFYWSIARNQTGTLAWILLIFIIFSSLLSKVFTKCKIFKQLIPLRKEAGILIFLVAIFHAISHLILNGANDISQINKELFTNLSVALGTISVLIMLPLFITSNNYSIKKLNGKNWKFLHKFTHLAFILAALHIALIPYLEFQSFEPGPLIILAIYLLGYTYLYFKKNKSNAKKIKSS